MMSRRRCGNATAFPSSCLSLFGISLPGVCIVLWEHVKHQKALSPDIPTLVPDTKHCEVPKVLGAPNQHSATSQLKLGKQASASASPLGFLKNFFPLAVPLEHSAVAAAIQLSRWGTLAPYPMQIMLPRTFVWWQTHNLKILLMNCTEEPFGAWSCVRGSHVCLYKSGTQLGLCSSNYATLFHGCSQGYLRSF